MFSKYNVYNIYFVSELFKSIFTYLCLSCLLIINMCIVFCSAIDIPILKAVKLIKY